MHGVGALGLDAVDPAPWQRLLDGAGDAGAQPAAADRHDHRVEIRQLLGHLEADGGGAEDGVPPLERVDERPALLALDPADLGERLVDVGHEDHLGAVGLAAGHPGRVGVLRHHHLGAGAQHARRIAHRHGVVAGADRADAAGQLLRRQRQHVDQRPARLEAAGVLEELQLEPDLGALAEQAVEPMAAQPPDRCPAHPLAQLTAGSANLVETRRRCEAVPRARCRRVDRHLGRSSRGPRDAPRRRRRHGQRQTTPRSRTGQLPHHVPQVNSIAAEPPSRGRPYVVPHRSCGHTATIPSERPASDLTMRILAIGDTDSLAETRRVLSRSEFEMYRVPAALAAVRMVRQIPFDLMIVVHPARRYRLRGLSQRDPGPQQPLPRQPAAGALAAEPARRVGRLPAGLAARGRRRRSAGAPAGEGRRAFSGTDSSGGALRPAVAGRLGRRCRPAPHREHLGQRCPDRPRDRRPAGDRRTARTELAATTRRCALPSEVVRTTELDRDKVRGFAVSWVGADAEQLRRLDEYLATLT